jgi:hypothetical protein
MFNELDPVFGRVDAPITFVVRANGLTILPVYDVTCVVCGRDVDAASPDAAISRIDGNSVFGYEANHNSCFDFQAECDALADELEAGADPFPPADSWELDRVYQRPAFDALYVRNLPNSPVGATRVVYQLTEPLFVPGQTVTYDHVITSGVYVPGSGPET